MIREIKTAALEVLLALSPRRSLIESMISFDFKIGDEKRQLMKLCFSPLAAWPLLILLVLIYLDPTKNLWSLQRLLQGNYQVTFTLLDGRMLNAASFFLAFFTLERLVKNEYVLIGIIFYFLSKSELHFYLAVAALLGTFLGRATNLWSLRKSLVSVTAQIWIAVTTLQMIATVVSSVVTVYALEVLAGSGYFSGSIAVNRREFFFLSVVLHYSLQLIFLAAWGHFRKSKRFEPSDFPINYSTSTWLKKLRLRNHFAQKLAEQAVAKTILHQNNLKEITSIKDLSPVSIPAKISKILQVELEFLKLASSRLTAK